jgi:hypothetical protein
MMKVLLKVLRALNSTQLLGCEGSEKLKPFFSK